MDTLLHGSAFITGAASGIGKATAVSFLQHGVTQLAICDINEGAIRVAADEFRQSFPDARILPLVIDVADEHSLAKGVEDTVEAFGRLDIAVNNAGIAGANSPSDVTDVRDWQRVIDVNMKGVWLSSRAEIRQMLKQEPRQSDSKRHGRGVIVNVASMFGIVASPKTIPAGAYTAAKHAVIGMTKSDAIMYASDGIRINSICPGYVGTPLFLASLQNDTIRKEVKAVPMRRLAQMDEIGDAIAFLASPMSSYMCGTSLIVDGGVTAL